MGGAAVMEMQLPGPELSLPLSAVRCFRPRTEPVPPTHTHTHWVPELHDEVPEGAPTANSLLSPFFFFVTWSGRVQA